MKIIEAVRVGVLAFALSLLCAVVAVADNAAADSADSVFAKIDWQTITPAELDALIVRGDLDVNGRYALQGEDKFSPLWHAAEFGNFDLLDVLAMHGADVNQTVGNHKRTLLHVLSKFCAVVEMRRLLELGADVHLQSRDGELAIFNVFTAGKECLSAGHRRAAIDVLLEYGADWDVEKGWPESRAADVTALAAMIQCTQAPGNYEGVLPYLVSRGADVNKYHLPRHNPRTNARPSAIQTAAMICNLEDGVLQELIALGADVNLARDVGGTPLMMFAVGGRDIAVFDYLTEAGADVDVKNTVGSSVLTFARARQRGLLDHEYRGIESVQRFFAENLPDAEPFGFSDIESYRAIGGEIVKRIESLCENRAYEVCAELELDEVLPDGGATDGEKFGWFFDNTKGEGQ